MLLTYLVFFAHKNDPNLCEERFVFFRLCPCRTETYFCLRYQQGQSLLNSNGGEKSNKTCSLAIILQLFWDIHTFIFVLKFLIKQCNVIKNRQ